MYKFNEMKKNVVIASAVAIAIILVIIISKSCQDDRVVSYSYETIGKGVVEKTITASGNLKVDDLHLVLAKTDGMISRIHTTVNKQVSKGQLIVSIDSSDIDRSIKKFKAEYDIMIDELEKEKRELENSNNMYKENLISKQSLENQKLKYRTSMNKFKKMKIDYDILLENKRDTRIYAPVSGVITEFEKEENQPVRVNQVVFHIAPTMKKMILTIDVDESDIGFVEKNQKTTFSVSAYPDEKFHGKITSIAISPTKKGGIISYMAEIACDNNELKLKPGMTAAATVIVRKKENVLRVLNQAFIISPTEMATEDEGKFVWLKTSSIIGSLPVKRIPVKVGIEGDMYTEILGGLKPGDKVLKKITEEKK